MSSEQHDRQLPRPGLLVAALGIALTCQIFAFHGLRYDDPFITYRYGQNLATGHGLTFNPGQRFLGSTSPGQMLLSAGVYALAGRDLTPSLMSSLGCVAWSAQAVGVYALLVPSLAVEGALAVAAAIELGAAGSQGVVPFETNIVAAFAIWALASARRKRWLSTAALSGFAVLMRPDALLLAGLLAALCVYDLRQRAWRPACVLLAIVLPWVIFAYAYYGSPLPHSASTKFQRSTFDAYLVHMARLVGEVVLPYASSLAACCLGLVGLAFATFRLVRRDRFMVVVVVYGALHACAYLVLRPFIDHSWHLYPLSIVCVTLELAGLWTLCREIRGVALQRGVVVASVLLVLAMGARVAQSAQQQVDSYWSGWRNQSYLSIARYLSAHARADEHFASFEVGTIAYYTQLTAYDLAGLVTDNETLHHDPAARWLVLDKDFLSWAPKFEPEYGAKVHDFVVLLFHVPENAHLEFGGAKPANSL